MSCFGNMKKKKKTKHAGYSTVFIAMVTIVRMSSGFSYPSALQTSSAALQTRPASHSCCIKQTHSSSSQRFRLRQSHRAHVFIFNCVIIKQRQVSQVGRKMQEWQQDTSTVPTGCVTCVRSRSHSLYPSHFEQLVNQYLINYVIHRETTAEIALVKTFQHTFIIKKIVKESLFDRI